MLTATGSAVPERREEIEFTRFELVDAVFSVLVIQVKNSAVDGDWKPAH